MPTTGATSVCFCGGVSARRMEYAPAVIHTSAHARMGMPWLTHRSAG
jgi:hypothetical protein